MSHLLRKADIIITRTLRIWFCILQIKKCLQKNHNLHPEIVISSFEMNKKLLKTSTLWQRGKRHKLLILFLPGCFYFDKFYTLTSMWYLKFVKRKTYLLLSWLISIVGQNEDRLHLGIFHVSKISVQNLCREFETEWH